MPDAAGVMRNVYDETNRALRISGTNVVGGGTVDGLAANIAITPVSPLGDGIVVKSPDAAWNVTGPAGGNADYGKRNVFVYEKYNASSTDPNNNLLFRITSDGSLGLGGNLHVPTGLRQDAGYASAWAVRVEPSVSTVLLQLIPASAQATNTVEWYAPGGATKRGVIDGNGVVTTYLTDGTTAAGWLAGADGGNAGIRLALVTGSTTTTGMWLKGAASQSAPLIDVLNSSSAHVFQVNKDGRVMIAVNSVPAAGDLASSQLSLWFDATNGAAKLMVYAKQADGTVRTGSLALA